jgi:hypothetical protein
MNVQSDILDIMVDERAPLVATEKKKECMYMAVFYYYDFNFFV